MKEVGFSTAGNWAVVLPSTGHRRYARLLRVWGTAVQLPEKEIHGGFVSTLKMSHLGCCKQERVKNWKTGQGSDMCACLMPVFFQSHPLRKVLEAGYETRQCFAWPRISLMAQDVIGAETRGLKQQIDKKIKEKIHLNKGPGFDPGCFWATDHSMPESEGALQACQASLCPRHCCQMHLKAALCTPGTYGLTKPSVSPIRVLSLTVHNQKFGHGPELHRQKETISHLQPKGLRT